MKKYLVTVLFLLLEISYSRTYALSLNPLSIVKQLHKGADEVVSGTVKGATEVVGTPVDIKEVTFYLHTSKDQGYPNHTINPFQPEEISKTQGKIYFFIHGWTQSREDTPWYKPLTEHLLKVEPDAHIVQVDWSKPASDNYGFAAFSTESVGNIIGNLIHKLVAEFNVQSKNLVVIGHSLGGQVTGWVGKRFHQLSNTKLPRIIALDPAGPLFSVRPNGKRLNKKDADIVMVVHSDGGKLGIQDKTGTIDFFPNGGSDQPGCSKVDLGKISSLADPVWCDHRRGYNLFVEAVKQPKRFIAKECKDFDHFKNSKCDHIEVSLGDLLTTQTGSFYLETTDKSPFFKQDDTETPTQVPLISSEKKDNISNYEGFKDNIDKNSEISTEHSNKTKSN